MALCSPASLSALSDDVLLLIFSHLKSWDLLNLSRTCQRLGKVARDRSLWREVDLSDGCLAAGQLGKCLGFLQPMTRRLVVRGCVRHYAGTPRWCAPLLTPSLLRRLAQHCPGLQELEVREAYVDAAQLRLAHLAPLTALRSLALHNCEFVNLPSPAREGSYFRRAHQLLPGLQTLEVVGCGWLDDYDVMVLSKASVLRRLVLRRLPRVGRAMAYLALAFRFGFQNVEELDLRGTGLEAGEVVSVVQNGNLRVLRLGPEGPVHRLPWEPGRDRCVMVPDPRWQEEQQQVVVINVEPDGPRWRQVDEDELEGLGLQWVRRAPGRPAHDPEAHVFFDHNGRPLQPPPPPPEESLKCRPEEDKEDPEEDLEEDGGEDFGPYSRDEARPAAAEETVAPDEGLSDKLVDAFGSRRTRGLHTLGLAGCALTDHGLLTLLTFLPALAHLDISRTRVTHAGLLQARAARPDCNILCNPPPAIHRTPAHREGSPAHRRPSPQQRQGSPAPPRSPQHREGSPAHRERSPAHRNGSPAHRNESPSPQRSPAHNEAPPSPHRSPAQRAGSPASKEGR